jgi:indolepyruvate ferredoxin oxidoreductase
VALRTLAKTYWIKDEVFVAHLMTSPMKTLRDRESYGNLGTKFKVKHINRPSFVVLGKKIEFDFSPQIWMLKIMRQLRGLRQLMPQWHKEERRIAARIRSELLTANHTWETLKKLDNIKGYREVRIANAATVFPEASA